MSIGFRREALAAIVDSAAVLARAGAASPLEISTKSDGSPLTAVDSAVNAFLRRELTLLLPESAWLSEESDDDPARLRHDSVWIVDPIDGTKQLVRGIPEVAISIGLTVSGRVAAAAIVNPMTGERGSWVEGSPPVFEGLTARSVPVSLDRAEAIVSRTETEAGELANLGPVVGFTRPVGSVAYKLLRVAAGADALTFSLRPKSEWDICGGVGLLLATGRAYLRLDGAPNRFNRKDPVIPSGAVAGPEPLASALRDRLIASRP